MALLVAAGELRETVAAVTGIGMAAAFLEGGFGFRFGFGGDGNGAVVIGDLGFGAAAL